MADSFNELFGLGSHSEDASLEGWWPLQDDAASTAVDDASSNGNDGTLVGGDNTADISTTGPNNWLTKALDLDGTSDYITTTVANAFGDFTAVARYRSDGVNAFQRVVDKAYDVGFWIGRDSSTADKFGGGVRESLPPYGRFVTLTDGSWHEIATIRDGTDHTIRGGASSTATGTVSSTATSTDSMRIGTPVSGSGMHNGLLADVAVFSRALTAAEYSEWRLGPETVNTVAPALSGTETQGQTLSVTTGTWALDSPFASGSNGTATYGYQWTRSNDAIGTGEADIGGATSSSYVLVGPDVGKFIRCRVRATNDGGFDSAADTNSDMSGAIVAGVSPTAAIPNRSGDSINWLCPVDWQHPLAEGLLFSGEILANQPGWQSDVLLNLCDPVSGPHGGITNTSIAAWRESAFSGKAFLYGDDVDNYVRIAEPRFDPTANWTVQWVGVTYSDTSVEGASNSIISQQDGGGTGRNIIYQWATDDTISTFIGGSGKSSGVTMERYVEYHIFLVHENGVLKWYIDGQKRATHSVTAEAADGDLILLQGKGVAPTTPWNGEMRRVRVWDRALSFEQAKSLYQDDWQIYNRVPHRYYAPFTAAPVSSAFPFYYYYAGGLTL